MFEKYRMKKEIWKLNVEIVELLRSKLAMMNAIESMYKDDSITRQQFIECWMRYYDELERLQKDQG